MSASIKPAVPQKFDMASTLPNLPLAFVVRLLFLAILLSHPGNPVWAQSSHSIKDVVAAWDKRQRDVRVARFAWQERVTLPKGSVMDGSVPKHINPKGLLVPPEDLSYDGFYVLKFEDAKMYYSYKGKVWRAATGEAVSQEYFSVFDGKDSKIYWPKGADHIPSGVVRKETRNIDAQNIHALAILKTYRPLNQSLGIYGIGDFFVSKQHAMFEDKPCLLLQERRTDGRAQSASLWVDPAQDYSIVRYVSEVNGAIDFKVDIKFTRHPEYGWMPSSWDGVQMKPGGHVRETFTARVSEFVINDPDNVGSISLDFPPDTYVIDDKNGSRYIAREGNGKRPITDDERRAPYEQLLVTESGEGLRGERPWLQRHWIILLFGGLTATAIAFLWYRRRRVA